MPEINKSVTRIPTLVVLGIGLFIIALSALYASSFLVIIGVSVAFWSAVLIYITPSKHVPLTLLNVCADPNSSNTERILTQFGSEEKGIYLPPNRINDIESSLVFIPATPTTPLPQPGEVPEQSLYNQKDELFVTPPGLSLCRFFEQELNISFVKTDLSYLQKTLPTLLVNRLEIAEKVEIQVNENLVHAQITGSLFNSICEKTKALPRAHQAVGCLLASAIACSLAKASGHAIRINKEVSNQQDETCIIEYQLLE